MNASVHMCSYDHVDNVDLLVACKVMMKSGR